MSPGVAAGHFSKNRFTSMARFRYFGLNFSTMYST